MSYDLLILGASVRAAASSAVRAGLRPWCADQFADRDLASICTVERIEAGKAGFETLIGLVDRMPKTPWFYTGGFENQPDAVEQISRRHPLWGVQAEVLTEVRNPARVSEVLQAAGIDGPRVRMCSGDVPTDGSWLAKPLRSGGGIGIETYTGKNNSADVPRYYQERVEGDSFSAIYIGTRSAAHLIGVSRQLVGIPGSPFVYRGSVGPVLISDRVGEQLDRIGQCLAEGFGLDGWFGVDYVNERETVRPVEVNPRYTASIEIHELSRREALLPLHALACQRKELPPIDQWRVRERPPAIFVGKCVLYASRQLIVGTIDWAPPDVRDAFAISEIADVPIAGTRFKAGEPVLSVLAAGTGLADCESRLRKLALEWRQRLELDA